MPPCNVVFIFILLSCAFILLDTGFARGASLEMWGVLGQRRFQWQRCINGFSSFVTCVIKVAVRIFFHER